MFHFQAAVVKCPLFSEIGMVSLEYEEKQEVWK
jgi:hypothetical protein